jgi:hypothetical protein
MSAVHGVSLRRSSVRKLSLMLILATMLGPFVWLFAALRQEFAEGYLDFIIFYTGGKILLSAETRFMAAC